MSLFITSSKNISGTGVSLFAGLDVGSNVGLSNGNTLLLKLLRISSFL